MALAVTSRASTGMKQQAAMKKAASMKAKRATKVAKGRMAKAQVFRGRKEKTVGGLKQESLMKNKRGKIVSKRQSALGKRKFSNVEAWVDSVMEARQALHISGFVAINGKTLQGKALYVKTRALLAARLGSSAMAAAASPNLASADASASEVRAAAGKASAATEHRPSVAAAGGA